ncbi:MAG: 30S ribosomal protein S4 [Candidatus Omnitrophica bacterium]|nr:30S ribosomal protein S4 [Candidatus Omnitrophota bacterium]MBU4487553.1 30S ribosomal protein S4 [Candidatus Omnitrophota bacterium]MCG2705793.1 30S ribosomal protein S4 [Candidatus Omnitrophota bacterium]
MARQRKPLCKLCRREGTKLFLKGSRCNTDKCAVARRAYAPGQHGQKRSKLSDYGIQLREKQKAKKIYGVLERQFRHYFFIAERSKGVTGEVLLQLLERRLDNVIYRLPFAPSRQGARQLVRHGKICVNDKKVNIPSYLVTEGDVITVKSDEKLKKKIQDTVELTKDTRAVPAWLAADYASLKGEVKRLPIKADIGYAIQEQLIVELYSK